MNATMIDTPDIIADDPGKDLDWENRRPCSDDSCIGTIGPDGRCRICGLLDTIAPVGPELPAGIGTVEDEPQELQSEDEMSDPQDPEWEDRKLCSDESCIGTIGTDGRCRVCGLAG